MKQMRGLQALCEAKQQETIHCGYDGPKTGFPELYQGAIPLLGYAGQDQNKLHFPGVLDRGENVHVQHQHLPDPEDIERKILQVPEYQHNTRQLHRFQVKGVADKSSTNTHL